MSEIVENKKTLGEILRSRREELQMTVTEVAAYLRVKPSDIEAVENNNLRRVTNHIYAPGFIRSYAKFLRTDQRVIEDQISSLKLKSNVENKAHVLINLEESDDLAPTRSMVLHSFLAAGALFLIFFLIYNFRIDKSDLITNEDLVAQLNSIFSNESEGEE
jgi:cytoskeletal protein RodZ